MYHSLSDGRHPDRTYPSYTTTKDGFAAQLERLRAGGHRLSTFRELERCLDEGTPIPERTCVVSVDDGHKSGLEMAEVLARAGGQGTFFLTMGYCTTRPDFLSRDEIRALADMGHDLGTHGVTHRALSRLPRKQMIAELRDSKRWLEDLVGRPVTAMSLPAGEGSEAVFAAAFALGYRLVGTSIERLTDLDELPMTVNRLVVRAGHSPAKVARMAIGAWDHVLARRVRSSLLALPRRALRSYDRVR
jgi:peptidoglycan/xylan/chitin deacetylase (PgdA/CDA1 family)